MTIKTQYDLTIRMTAKSILESSSPESTSSTYVMDGVTTRNEKAIIKQLLTKYTNILSDEKEFDLDTSKSLKIIQLLNSRMDHFNKWFFLTQNACNNKTHMI